MKINVIKPEFTHLKTVIFLHALNQSNYEINSIIEFIKDKKRGVKFIIPLADKINVIWPNGNTDKINAWYNYYTWNDNISKHDSICLEEFKNSSDSIKKIIINEAKIINPEKIFTVGISQGGTIAIDACLKLPFRIKKVICIDTIFLDSYFQSSYSKQNFIVFQSMKDDVYNPIFQDSCYKKLLDNKCRVIKNKYNFSHTQNIEFITRFINSNIA